MRMRLGSVACAAALVATITILCLTSVQATARSTDALSPAFDAGLENSVTTFDATLTTQGIQPDVRRAQPGGVRLAQGTVDTGDCTMCVTAYCCGATVASMDPDCCEQTVASVNPECCEQTVASVNPECCVPTVASMDPDCCEQTVASVNPECCEQTVASVNPECCEQTVASVNPECCEQTLGTLGGGDCCIVAVSTHTSDICTVCADPWCVQKTAETAECTPCTAQDPRCVTTQECQTIHPSACPGCVAKTGCGDPLFAGLGALRPAQGRRGVLGGLIAWAHPR